MSADIDFSQEASSAEPLFLARPAWGISLKYASDFAIALVLLALSLPFILLAAILVKLSSSGPIFYSQTRLGWRGRPYRIYKIRTMIHNCEKHSGPRWSTPGDARITPVGRFLRRTHLDELPQLWNVIRGEMSLVGPRPERPEFAVHLVEVIPYYRKRLLVRPGVTGLAQVQLPGDTDIESVRRKLAYDLHYVQHLTPWMDLRIILSTVCKVLGASFLQLQHWFRLPSLKTVEAAFEQIILAAPNQVKTESAPPNWEAVSIAR